MPDAKTATPTTESGSASSEGFDVLMERLRGVVARLEEGSLSLEESLAAFEEGVTLSRRGAAILDAVERRVDVLTKQGDDEKVAAFSPEEGTAEEKNERRGGR